MKPKVIVFDLDDTICQTRWIFEKQMKACADYLANALGGKNSDEWLTEIETVNNRLFEIFKVNPKRWVKLVDQIAANADQNIKERAIDIFNQIYFKPLPFVDGAEETLKMLTNNKINMAIHTHANADWTWRKYEWLGLDRFFDKEKILISNEDDHKTAASWKRVFDELNCPPEEGMVVGDSPRSDINPALEIGVKECVLYQGGEIWSVHQMDVPKTVRIVKDIREILD